MANPVLLMNASAVLSKASTIEQIGSALETDTKQVDNITEKVRSATKGAFSLAYTSAADEVNAEANKHSKKVGLLGGAHRQAVTNTQAVDQQNASSVRIEQM